MKKQKFWWKTSFMVFIYALVLLSMMFLQDIIYIIGNYSEALEHLNSESFLFKILNGQVALPISALSFIWVGVCAAYIGVDRAAYAIKSSKMVSGETDVGDPATIRKIILISGLVLLFGCISNCFIDYDFELNSLASAFGSSVLLYIAGQKAIKSVKYVDGDLDGDGIPDDMQETEYSDQLSEDTESLKEGVKTIVSGISQIAETVSQAGE